MQRRRRKEEYIEKIDWAFYNEEKIREAVNEARNKAAGHEVRSENRISDPTAAAVINALTPIGAVLVSGRELAQPERWLEVIENTYAWSYDNAPVFYAAVRRRYSGDYYRRICFDLNISEPQFYSLINKFRTYAALQAAQLNLVWI